MIRVNVGGKTFTTSKEILLQSVYFAGLWALEEQSKDLFVDRDPKAFRHVLAYLRDDTYTFPLRYKSELNFAAWPILNIQRIEKRIWCAFMFRVPVLH